MRMRPAAASSAEVSRRPSRGSRSGGRNACPRVNGTKKAAQRMQPDAPQESVLLRLLGDPRVQQQDKILICLALGSTSANQVRSIRQTAIEAGFRSAWSWNISSVLASSNGNAIRTPFGWRLTLSGRCAVRRLADAHGVARARQNRLKAITGAAPKAAQEIDSPPSGSEAGEESRAS